MSIPAPTQPQTEVLGAALSPAKSERKIYEYCLVSNTDRELFESGCSVKLEHRWEPVGGVCISRILGIIPHYYQSFKRTFRG